MTDAELLWVEWACAVCGRSNEAPFDPALGARQTFTEDCGSCCRPNLLRVRADARAFDQILLNRQEGQKAKVILLDPRKTPVRSAADVHLAPRPGYDLAVTPYDGELYEASTASDRRIADADV